MFLSCRVLSGPKNDAVLVGGQMAEWVVVNDGTVPWPEHTTLRLVGGPVVASPVVEVPSAAPGQTVVLELEALTPEQDGQVFEAIYAFVTQDGQPFGDILTFRVEGKNQELEAPGASVQPVCAVLVSPCDSIPQGLDSLQGELKNVEWTLANLGSVDWPDDAVAQLFYNTPGFAHLPTTVELPAAKVGQTVQVGITALMPECEGNFKAMWAVTSASAPDFGDILFVEFAVSDFPFMEWMLADACSADTISNFSSDTEPKTSERLSAAFALSNHFVPMGVQVDFEDSPSLAANEVVESLGVIANVVGGTQWTMELALTNDGTCPWPSDSHLVCCFGDGFGCRNLPLVSGDGLCAEATTVVNLELTAPERPAVVAWAIVGGGARFGPILALEVK